MMDVPEFCSGSVCKACLAPVSVGKCEAMRETERVVAEHSGTISQIDSSTKPTHSSSENDELYENDPRKPAAEVVQAAVRGHDVRNTMEQKRILLEAVPEVVAMLESTDEDKEEARRKKEVTELTQVMLTELRRGDNSADAGEIKSILMEAQEEVVAVLGAENKVEALRRRTEVTELARIVIAKLNGQSNPMAITNDDSEIQRLRSVAVQFEDKVKYLLAGKDKMKNEAEMKDAEIQHLRTIIQSKDAEIESLHLRLSSGHSRTREEPSQIVEAGHLESSRFSTTTIDSPMTKQESVIEGNSQELDDMGTSVGAEGESYGDDDGVAHQPQTCDTATITSAASPQLDESAIIDGHDDAPIDPKVSMDSDSAAMSIDDISSAKSESVTGSENGSVKSPDLTNATGTTINSRTDVAYQRQLYQRVSQLIRRRSYADSPGDTPPTAPPGGALCDSASPVGSHAGPSNSNSQGHPHDRHDHGDEFVMRGSDSVLHYLYGNG